MHSLQRFQKVFPFISLSSSYLHQLSCHSKPWRGFHSSQGRSSTRRLLWGLPSPECPYRSEQADWNKNLLQLQKKNHRLRTFAPIATAHRYCARKFKRHVPIHRARVLRNKTNNGREDGHCYSFAWIFRWLLLFFSETDFIYNDLHIVQKRAKTEHGKLKKIQNFCLRDVESCHLAAARCVKLWSLNSSLFFKGPHQLTKFT